MAAENVLILSVLFVVVAKFFYELGRVLGRGEMLEAHDLYLKAAREKNPDKRIEMINQANRRAFPDAPFTRLFQMATRK